MARVTFLCELAVFLLVVVCCASSLRIAGPSRPCLRRRCYRPCPYGYVTIRGCQTCQCKDGPIKHPVCGPICKRFCPNGFQLDRYGCPTCTCKPCPQIKCSRPCPNGYKRVRGCQTCTCNKPPSCPPVCLMHCPNGFVKDGRGCSICKCNPFPHTPVCGPICRMRCPNGFVKDRRGCPICKCNPFPRPCSQGQCALSCLRGRPQPDGCSCPPCGRRDRDLYLQ